MTARVEWSSMAVAQFRQLTPSQQRNALLVVGNLEADPLCGTHEYTRSLPHRGQEAVFVVYGMQIKLRYTLPAWGKRQPLVLVIGVFPTDYPTQDNGAAS